jgi:ABC-2 type transport system permease protein
MSETTMTAGAAGRGAADPGAGDLGAGDLGAGDLGAGAATEADPAAGEGHGVMAAWVRPAWALAWRDLLRFARQPTRVVSAILTPLLFWAMLGFGVGEAFAPGAAGGMDGVGVGEGAGLGYAAYLLPGSALLLVMFTAIFSTIGVIEDRREGFLQSVTVSPAARGAVVAGKLGAAGALAIAQAAVLLAIGWAATGTLHGVAQLGGAAVALALAAAAFGGVGLAAAWVMRSTAGYHAGMMVVLMPMWAVSGAVFPFATAPTAMQAVMLCNPVTYLHALLAAVVIGPGMEALVVSPWVAGPAAVAVAAGGVALAGWAVRRG